MSSNRPNLHDDRLRSLHLGHSSWYDYRLNQPYQPLRPIPPPQWLHPAYMHPAFPHPQPPGYYLPLGHAPNQHWPAPPFGQPMRPPPQPQRPQQPQQPPLPPAPEEEARRVSRVAVSGLEARLIAAFLAVQKQDRVVAKNKVGWLQNCFRGDLEWVRSLLLHPELTSLSEKGLSKELYNSHFACLLHSTRRGAPPEESSFIAIRDR